MTSLSPMTIIGSDELQQLIESLVAARNYIIFVGLNRTEKGFQHPQELLLVNMEKSLTVLGVDFEPR
jgi:hypothetical protein